MPFTPPTPTDLAAFGLGGMLRCGLELRERARRADSVQEVGEVVVRYFHDVFRDPVNGERQCALVRFYRTRSFGELPEDDRAFARDLLGGVDIGAETRCLTLVATAGSRPEWNDRAKSRGHRVIPLLNREMVERAPMIAQLVTQLGLDIGDVVQPDPEVIRGLQGKTYNVFHVEHARDNPYIPAQRDFVLPFGIESVIGFGGLIGSDLFSVILFSTVPITAESASRFRTLALDVKGVLHVQE